MIPTAATKLNVRSVSLSLSFQLENAWRPRVSVLNCKSVFCIGEMAVSLNVGGGEGQANASAIGYSEVPAWPAPREILLQPTLHYTTMRIQHVNDTGKCITTRIDVCVVGGGLSLRTYVHYLRFSWQVSYFLILMLVYFLVTVMLWKNYI